MLAHGGTRALYERTINIFIKHRHDGAHSSWINPKIHEKVVSDRFGYTGFGPGPPRAIRSKFSNIGLMELIFLVFSSGFNIK